MSRDWRLFIDDILQACKKARRYSNGMTQEQLLADDRTYDAVLRNLEIIGEAAKHLPPEVTAKIPGIEWTKVTRMRDWLAHAYFGIDPKIVWNVVSDRLPELEIGVQTFVDAGYQ